MQQTAKKPTNAIPVQKIIKNTSKARKTTDNLQLIPWVLSQASYMNFINPKGKLPLTKLTMNDNNNNKNKKLPQETMQNPR